jgi:hypothetical protein
MGITYMYPYKKNERKGDLIKGLQEKLGTVCKLAPWVTDLVTEFQECRWSETAAQKIVNASEYHLLDSSEYFADLIPAPDTSSPRPLTQDQRIYEANRKISQLEHRVGRAEAYKIIMAGGKRRGWM